MNSLCAAAINFFCCSSFKRADKMNCLYDPITLKMLGYKTSDRHWKKKLRKCNAVGVNAGFAGLPPFLKNHGCICIRTGMHFSSEHPVIHSCCTFHIRVHERVSFQMKPSQRINHSRHSHNVLQVLIPSTGPDWR